MVSLINKLGKDHEQINKRPNKEDSSKPKKDKELDTVNMNEEGAMHKRSKEGGPRWFKDRAKVIGHMQKVMKSLSEPQRSIKK